MAKRAATLCALLYVLAFGVKAETTTIRIAGSGGIDKEVVHGLVADVLQEDIGALGVEVNYLPIESGFNQYIINALSSGTAPDLFYVDVSMIDVFAGSGKIASFNNPLMADVFIPVLTDSFTVDHSFYAVPKDFNSLALIYNRDIFDDAAVPYPTAEDTHLSLFEKLKAVVAALGNEGVYGACFQLDFTRFAPFLYATGWQPIGEDQRTRIDEKFERAFRFYIDLFQSGVVVPASNLGQSWSGGCFGAERTAIAMEGNWIAGYLRDKAPNLVFGAVPSPKDAITGQAGNLLFTVGWAVNLDGGNVEQAMQVADVLTSEKSQRWVLNSGLALPSRSSMSEEVMSSQSTQYERLAAAVYATVQRGYVRPYNFSPYGQSWSDPIAEAISGVLVGGVAIEDALKTAQKRYDYMYEKMLEVQ